MTSHVLRAPRCDKRKAIVRDFRDADAPPPGVREIAQLRNEADRLRIALVILLALLAVILSIVAANR